MKRFINLGHQINDDKSERPQFAFYCTVLERFEVFNDECVWDSIEEFKCDFKSWEESHNIEPSKERVERYLNLIPESFGKGYNPMKQLVDALNDLLGEDLIQANLDKIDAWAEKYNTEKE